MTKKERRVKFNFIDVLIIFVVIVMAIVGYKIVTGENVLTESIMPDVTFTMEAQKIDKSMEGSVKVGDKLVNSLTGEDLGEVVDVRYTPSDEVIDNREEGIFEKSEYEDKIDIYIDIKGHTTEFDDEIKIGEQIARVGTQVYIRNKNYAFSGYILDVNVEEVQ